MRVRGANVEEAERLTAEAYAAGATGLEERDEERGIGLTIYAPESTADRVWEVLHRAAVQAIVEAPRDVPELNWSRQWKLGHAAVVISPRLLIRPSFVSAELGPGQAELVIDPGQAFGTGSHPSTHLALEWIDALAPALKPGARALDVGIGTGVLALAALRLASVSGVGDVRAVGFDLDPLATEASRANASVNGLATELDVFCGPLAAMADGAFALVMANLLRTELLPLLAPLRDRVEPDGHAVFSGLIEAERRTVERALVAAGWRVVGVRRMDDAGGEPWQAFLTTR